METQLCDPAYEKVLADLAQAIPVEVLPPVATGGHVAALVGASEESLSQDRYLGRGIPYTKVGRRVRYLRGDVLAFLAAHRVQGAA